MANPTVGTLLTRGFGSWGSMQHVVRLGLFRPNINFSRTLSTSMGAEGSIDFSFRPPRRLGQVADTRVNSVAVGTDRTVRETDTNTDRTVERF